MRRSLDAITVCGPSGVGKGTLLGRILKNYPDYFAYSVSHTTRNMRKGEKDGREYYFVDIATMNEMERRGEFIETCEVHGNKYGTSWAAINSIRNSGKVCIFEVDVQGAEKIHQRSDILNTEFIFIAPPSLEELCRRIRIRGSESEATLQRRLCTAQNELNFFNENRSFFSYVILNNDIDVAYEELVKVFSEIFEKYGMKKLIQQQSFLFAPRVKEEEEQLRKKNEINKK